MELTRLKALSTAKSACVVKRDVCIRKELYVECRVVGGTAVFKGQ